MRKLALGLVASVFAFGAAHAGDLMASRYENTVTITDAAGAVTKISKPRPASGNAASCPTARSEPANGR